MTNKEPDFKSGIYSGTVQHRRYSPVSHCFKYNVFMMYLDLDEIQNLLNTSLFWSTSRFALARFKRGDYFGNPDKPLDQAVREAVNNELPVDVSGPVRVLTNFRYFGFIINPISTYYCYDKDENLQAMLLEVTNTPWKEKTQYVLKCNPKKNKQRITFDKAMHVSPFHPMNMNYDWRSLNTDDHISIHMKNMMSEEVIFDATLSLRREEITAGSLTKKIIQYPFMTLKVVAGIYFQALKLVIKKVPLYSHPNKKNSVNT